MRRRFLAALLLVCSALVLAGPHAPRAGDLPPDLVGKTLDGEPVQLSAYAGKAIVVTYWATWCPYCLKELPILEGIQKAVGKEHMQVIAVNTEERDVFRKAERALRSMGLQMAFDPGRVSQDAYGVHGIPHMVIIGHEGRIVAVYRGYGESSLDRIVVDINRATGAQPAP